MKMVRVALAVLFAGPMLAYPWTALAQTETVCGQSLDAPLRARASLSIDSSVAGLEIIGTDTSTIHVTCTAKDDQERHDVHLKLSGDQDHADLTIRGGSSHNNGLQIRVEVPRKTSLKINMDVGQVKVEEVAGNKDISLFVGQIIISSERLWNYQTVDVSVGIGQVEAQVYGTDKGGFFRSFSKETADGEYSLRAHTTIGQIELIGSHPAPAAQ
jgi:hypothetical protein